MKLVNKFQITFVLLLLLLIINHVNAEDETHDLKYELLVHNRRMKVCDNIIVNDIPGGKDAVIDAGKRYLESMHNQTIKPIEPFGGAWKWELFRQDFVTVPECKNLKIFGNERTNYDEAKRFCYYPNSKPGGCVVYSIGSNDKWDFEENFFKDADCAIETFDCTINATIPEGIRSRTKYNLVCLGARDEVNGGINYFYDT